MSTRVIRCTGLLVALLFLGVTANAQEQPLEPMLAEGLNLLDRQPEAGTRLLQQVYTADPAYLSPEGGSVALALGQVLRERNQVSQARHVWESGLRAQVGRRTSSPTIPVDPRLLDAYLEAVRETGAEVDAALVTTAFMYMFSGDMSQLPTESRRALARHVCMTELLTQAIAEQGQRAELSGNCQTYRSLDRRGESVVSWWRRQDPSPMTVVNERLNAHLSRVALARKEMSAPDTPTGLDDRGEVLIRFGEPTWRRSIDFGQGDFIQTIIWRGLPVRRGDFPSNEIWSYGHIDESGLYIFVQVRDGRYVVGTINDLIPSQLKQRSGARSPQAVDAQRALLETLRFALGQISMHHVGFSGRYIQVANDLEREEQRQINRQFQQPGIDTRGFSEVQHAAWNALSRNTTEDAYMADQRSKQMPDHYSNLVTPSLPMLQRSARFLADDGTTDLHLMWSVPASEASRTCPSVRQAPPLKGRARLMTFSPEAATGSLMLDSTYISASVQQNTMRHVVPLEGGTETVAVQVDLLGDGGGEVSRPTPACTGVVWVIGRRLLFEDDLTISDLLPFEVDDVVGTQQRLSEGFNMDILDPFLAPTIGPEAALGVYFEVYSRTDLSDNYVIEYAVQKRMRGGLLQRGQTRTSLYHARRAAIGRRLQAAFLIDRAEWQGAEEVEVVATVTNLATGQSVERTARFPVTR